MLQLHWVVLLLIVVASFTGGFMLCAILTMASQADDAMDRMHQKPGPHTGYDHKSDWPGNRR
jgi:hypothetical protein